MRRASVVAVALICAPSFRAQAQPTGPATPVIGGTVRFELLREDQLPTRIQGAYLGVRGDSLLLARSGGGPGEEAFPLDAVQALQRRVAGPHGSAGVLFGIVAGGGLQLLLCAAARPCIGPLTITASVVTGTVVGTRLASSGSRWEPWWPPSAGRP